MPKDIEAILKLIDELRNKLHGEADSKELTDPEIIRSSQELNKVLNEYYRLLKDKKEK